jgi:hypothetical protein
VATGGTRSHSHATCDCLGSTKLPVIRHSSESALDRPLIGGSGTSSLFGRSAEDILIAGTTSFDQNEGALNALQLEWNQHQSYATRICNLRSTGSFMLTGSGTNATVFSSAKGDSLTGGTGQDWYFARLSGSGVLDSISQLTSNESIDSLR